MRLLLIAIILSTAACATGPNDCTWKQYDGNNGHWYSKCVKANEKI